MRTDPTPAPHASALPRLYLREPGWRIAVKVGSEREFCYMAAPGQDYYHRLLDGEIFLAHGEEKLCLSCADRRGLLASESKTAIELVDAEGRRQTILRDDVEELAASTKSLMPEGFEQQVNRQQLADLLEFLTRPVAPEPTAPASR